MLGTMGSVRRPFVFGIVGIVFGAAGACTSHPSATPSDSGAAFAVDASVDATPGIEDEIRAAAISFMTDYCGVLQRCEPQVIPYIFGSLEACINANAPITHLLGSYGYGANATPDDMRACGAALAASDCSVNYLQDESIVPTACYRVYHGTLADGERCGWFQQVFISTNQCASGACYWDSPPADGYMGCGHCGALQPEGADCRYGCAPGTQCVYTSGVRGTCTRFRDVGEACNPAPCHVGLLCATGVCIAPPSDGSCDPAVGCAELSPYLGVALRFCNPATRRCEPVPLSPLGASCGPQASGPYLPCVPGATCARVHADAGGAGDVKYRCQPKLEEGAACNPNDYLEQAFIGPCKTGVCWLNRCQTPGPAQCNAPAVPP